MRRRDFLGYSAAAGGYALVSLGSRGWALQNPNAGKQRLVVIFLRGAVDGLNVVVPYTDQNYYAMRPTIAIPHPGQTQGALDLDGRFGLHPALQSLMPAWKERSLAFVHASGSPDETRSHFEAQAYMETGTPGVKITPDGWMNRLLAALPGQHAPTEAINFGMTLPKILAGATPVASIPTHERGYGHEMHAPAEDEAANAIFDRMYTGGDAISVAYREGRQAQTQIMSDLARDMTEAAAGAPSPAGFADDAAKLCQLMRQDPTIQLAFFGLSGWDTHVRQGGAEGQLAYHLKALGEGLAQLRTGLRDTYGHTVVFVISEFGRTAHENGNGGTDHGHGNVMWVMGGPVNGGKIYGNWPGLDEEELHEGRDLAVTTDFRGVLAGVLGDHLKLGKAALAGVFPQNSAQSVSNLIRVA
ncbi:MAG TPA: DUF1501 domain-containing protein [Rhizomicrobium sp.]|jgi:uncharacterized protein (DUF1501 family)|nr:DUF1501 domain-containing protein [Rhizomicrobium sp.]